MVLYTSSSSLSYSSNASTSGSFAADLLSRFAPDLERYETTLATPSTPPSDENPDQLAFTAVAADAPADPSSRSRKDQLSSAFADVVKAIPITNSSTVPSHATLVRLLDCIDRACTDAGTDALDSMAPMSTVAGAAGSQTESLRLAALARITYATHALVLDSLLQDASKLNDEAWFWTEVEESTFRAFSHLIQTLPRRLALLVRATLEMAAENASHTVRGTIDLARPSAPAAAARDRDSSAEATFRKTLRSILATPNMVTGILFPYQLRSEATVTFALVQQQAMERRQARSQATELAQTKRQSAEGVGSLTAKKRRAWALRSAALKLSPMHMVRHEARCKRRGLMHERDVLAEKLGELALQQTAPRQGEEKGASIETMSSDEVRVALLRDLGAKLDRLGSALHCDDVARPSSSSSSSGEVRVDMDAASSVEALMASLRALLHETLPRYSERTRLILSPERFGQPSQLTQNWPSLVVYPLAALVVSRYVSHNWDGIAAKLDEARETVRGLLVGWVWEPCMELLDTVRHGGDEERGGVLMSRESLASDVESLQRMVSSFAQEKCGLRGEELEAVAMRVRQGDLTPVLRVYEEELRTPLKSAVSGTLVRSLLIQIQKAKVDLETAMSGIDRLLKSQQLLFGAVGVAPALGVVYVTTNWVKAKLVGMRRGRGGRATSHLQLRAWEALRRIDHLLSTPPLPPSSSSSSSANSTLPPLQHGLMLLDLDLLRSASYPLLVAASNGNRHIAKRLHRQFLQDVRDLEASGSQPPQEQEGRVRYDAVQSVVQPGLGYWSRRAAVERMWRSWSGILRIGV
ncbi:Nuclear control of ATPase protein 2 [Thecaphora frezii]